MNFIRNDWYVAAWPNEVTEKPLARRLGNEPVVLYREQNGRAVALRDRCPHRGAALSMGEVVAEGLQCNYHGMVFGDDGKCRRIPAQDRIPSKACVKSFPLVEKDGFLWIWLGDPAKADPSMIVDYPYHNDEKKWPRKCDMKPVKGHYMLLVDNLMDLTHIGYMHKNTIGSGPANAYSEAITNSERTDRGVRLTRWLLDHVPPATYVKAVGFKGKVDRWQEFEFVAPGNVLQYTGATDAGTGAYDQNKRDGGIHLRIFHALTPETDNSCFYFFSTMTGYRQDDPAASELYHSEIIRTFQEDVAFIEVQQQRLEEFPEPQIDTIHDKVRVQARRYYQSRLGEEARESTENTSPTISLSAAAVQE
jgi:phenylpropionate dioxygenase-like ring-hydroxylating dioxygenase large terminal subunit